LLSRRALGLFALLALPGCETKRPPAAGRPQLPRLAERPEDLLPPGLDLVLRLDLGRLREVASSPALAPVQASLDRRLLQGEQASLLTLLRTRAEVLWIGLRGVPSGGRLDAVLVARGDFASFDPSTQGDAWERTPTVHPGRAIHERKGEAPRGVPSLLALIERRILVLATPLEAPAVRRVLESGPTPPTMEPPADGFLGLAARPPALARAAQASYPHLASVLSELAALEAVVDPAEGGLRLDLRLSARSENGAARLERVLLGWKDAFSSDDAPLVRALAAGARAERDGPRSLRVKVQASAETVRKLIDMLLG
jgi:hypothetical protein